MSQLTARTCTHQNLLQAHLQGKRTVLVAAQPASSWAPRLRMRRGPLQQPGHINRIRFSREVEDSPCVLVASWDRAGNSRLAGFLKGSREQTLSTTTMTPSHGTRVCVHGGPPCFCPTPSGRAPESGVIWLAPLGRVQAGCGLGPLRVHAACPAWGAGTGPGGERRGRGRGREGEAGGAGGGGLGREGGPPLQRAPSPGVAPVPASRRHASRPGCDGLGGPLPLSLTTASLACFPS